MRVANYLARWVRTAGFDYQCFHVLRMCLDRVAAGGPLPAGLRLAPVSGDVVAASRSAVVSDCAWYGGQESCGFALFRDEHIVCLQWIWFGARFAREAFWDLGAREAVSVHLVTVPEERGKGYATHLKRYSAECMREAGFVALYSRVWWTNAASLRVNEKSGWYRVGLTLSVATPWRSHPYSWRWAFSPEFDR